MGGNPLRTPRHRRLGEPLPLQLPNVTHAYPLPTNLYLKYHAVSQNYGVLIRVSSGYPPVKGKLHTRYAPVRRSPASEDLLPLDLHVLSLPLAFILSQDQTLRCNYFLYLIFFTRIILVRSSFILYEYLILAYIYVSMNFPFAFYQVLLPVFWGCKDIYSYFYFPNCLLLFFYKNLLDFNNLLKTRWLH